MGAALRVGCVEVTGGFLLLWSLLYYLDRDGLLVWAAVSMALHELGHIICLRLWGGRVALVRLSCVGVELRQAAGGPRSRLARAAVALAGPLASVSAAFLASRLAERWAALYLLAGLSLGHGLFNLLPFPALDGGRALEALGGPRLSGGLGLGLGMLLLAGGLWLLVRGRNPTLLLVTLWLLAAGKKPCNFREDMINYRSLNKGWSSAAAACMRKRGGRYGRYERL